MWSQGKFGTLLGVVGAVPQVGVGDRKRCRLLLAAAGCCLGISALGGEEGNFHVHFMQGPPGCLAILHGAHVDTYTHNRKTRHEWTQDELEDLQLQLQATASAVTMTKKKSP